MKKIIIREMKKALQAIAFTSITGAIFLLMCIVLLPH